MCWGEGGREVRDGSENNRVLCLLVYEHFVYDTFALARACLKLQCQSLLYVTLLRQTLLPPSLSPSLIRTHLRRLVKLEKGAKLN